MNMEHTTSQEVIVKSTAPFPERLFTILNDRRIGIAGQRVLDLGDIPSTLGRKFSAAGCQVINELHSEENDKQLTAPFDVICADQCWQNYQSEEKLRHLYTLLHPTGHLVISQRDDLPLYGNAVSATHHLLSDYPIKNTFALTQGLHSEWLSNLNTTVFKDIETFTIDEQVEMRQAAWREHVVNWAQKTTDLSAVDRKKLNLQLQFTLHKDFPPILPILQRHAIITAKPKRHHQHKNEAKELRIRPLSKFEQPPWELLLLADPSRTLIKNYLEYGNCFLALFDEEIIGEIVLFPHGNHVYELANVAVLPKFQGQGIGQQLIEYAIKDCTRRGAHTIKIATGNSSIDQLKLYQRCGFKLEKIESGYFLANYPHIIVENGIKCTDRIILTMPIKQPA